MLRRFSINFALFSMALDAILIAAALFLTASLRPLLNELSIAQTIAGPVDLPGILYIIFPLTWVFLMFSYSVYDGEKNLRWWSEAVSLGTVTLQAAALQAGILYVTFRETSRLLFVAYIAGAFLLMAAWRAAARLSFRYQARQGVTSQRVLIVGAGPVGREVESKIRTASIYTIRFVGFLDDDPGKRKDCADILGALESARKIIEEYVITDVVIALPQRAFERTNSLVNELDDLPVKIWLVPDYFHLTLHHAQVHSLAEIPMLDLRASALNDYQRLVKRVFDLCLTSLFMIPALPLMAVVAVCILLDDGAPVFFRQMRVGENGRPFRIYKFRTMVRDAEKLRALVEQRDADGNLIHKTKNDPRVTRVGHILRRFSLDELPQFFNILAGQMSLVGPRPEIPYLVNQYQPWQRKRFAIPQGLTGWWQIHDRSDKPMHLHTEDDLYYIQSYSIWLDIQILARTAWSVLRGKGAF